MKVTQQDEAARQTVLDIELDDDDLEPYLNRAYRRLVQKANIPGFRKGKAPRSIVERFLGREYMVSDVIDFLVSDVTSKAIAENDLDAGGLPRIELKSMDPVRIEATVPLSPLVSLNDYSGLRVARETTEVSDEQAGERLEQIRQGMATWEPADRKTRDGDMVAMDIAATVDGQALMEEADVVLLLDDEHDTVVPGFSKKVVGATKGKPKSFKLGLPDDYRPTIGGQSVAGKEAAFTVTVGEIKGREVPELDDEFAKGVGGGYDDLAALRQSVMDDLKAEADRSDKEAYSEAVVKALIDSAELTIPELLVDHEIDHIIADREQALARMNVGLADYLKYSGKTPEEFREEARKASLERLERTYVLQEFARAEGIEVGDEEVTSRLESLRASVPPEQAERVDLDSDETVESMRRNLQFEKSIDRLLEIAGDEVSPTGPKKAGGPKKTKPKGDPKNKASQKPSGRAGSKAGKTRAGAKGKQE